jgi:hypothetical protein
MTRYDGFSARGFIRDVGETSLKRGFVLIYHSRSMDAQGYLECGGFGGIRAIVCPGIRQIWRLKL